MSSRSVFFIVYDEYNGNILRRKHINLIFMVLWRSCWQYMNKSMPKFKKFIESFVENLRLILAVFFYAIAYTVRLNVVTSQSELREFAVNDI